MARRGQGRLLLLALRLPFLLLLFFPTAFGRSILELDGHAANNNVAIAIATTKLRRFIKNVEWGGASATQAEAQRRQLIGPGSSPPTCRARCGRCYPCRPVHVAIQPGVSFPLEYYPEAWRCKCGNKLYMP